MSILRTYNVQNPDSASVNVELSADGGVRVAGLSTFSGELRVGTEVTISGGIVTATSFRGTSANLTGLSTFTSGINVGTGASISSPATNVLTLGTNDTERVRINSNGAIGIGTASPQQPNIPSIHLHTNTSDDARIAITTPTKPNSRIGYFGLSDKFGMDVHNGFEIRDASASYATRLSVDSSGRVTMPYQPYARASSTTTQGATSAIPLNSNASYNYSRGGITISGNRFTVPVAGAYVIGYHHLGNSGSGACQIEIRHNGSYIPGTRTQDTNSSNDSFGTQTVKELNASDYIEFWVTVGAAHGNQDYNSMWIWLLG